MKNRYFFSATYGQVEEKYLQITLQVLLQESQSVLNVILDCIDRDAQFRSYLLVFFLFETTFFKDSLAFAENR